MLRSKNNGYILEITYDRESWDVVDSVLAKKTFDDGSWDMIDGGSEKVVLDKIAARTDNDIILDHYETILHHPNKCVSASLKEYKNGNIQQAIVLLEQNEEPIYSKRWFDSLLKHLRRISI